MKHILSLIAAALMLAAPTQAVAAGYGYCSNSVLRTNIFRVGSTETQGIAIKLDNGKLQSLKGKTISSLSIAFGSSRTTDGMAHLFIATAPDATPLVAQTVKISGAVKWLDFALDTPYTITGDEGELYIGYTAEISTKSQMLMADHDIEAPGCSYVYSDGKWIDLYGMKEGNASIRFNLADDTAFTDLMLRPISTDGYYRATVPYGFSGAVYNFGSQPITSFDLTVSIGNSETQTTRYSDLSLGQSEFLPFSLSEFATAEAGNLPIVVKISNINGADDADTSDNVYATDVFYYPEAMERSLLLEGFTGQTCHNCPEGHATINSFLSTVETPVIEVMHHAGYSPDFMTMSCDLDYTYFYGSSSTYAPAVMLNRTHAPAVGTVPVMNVTASNLNAALAVVEAQQPYVSLALETEYDAVSRVVNVKVRTLVHNDLPADKNVINVMLAQNNVQGLQVPYGTEYVHNAVCRGALTGNSWGILLADSHTVGGAETEWSTSFTLPERTFSDAYDWDALTPEQREVYSIPAEVEDMYIVAYVAAYDGTNVNGHTVYNAVETPLGSSHVQGGMASIGDVTYDKVADIQLRVDGRRIVAVGECDSLRVFTITGEEVDARAQLIPGIYVVRAASGSSVVVKKLMIR